MGLDTQFALIGLAAKGLMVAHKEGAYGDMLAALYNLNKLTETLQDEVSSMIIKKGVRERTTQREN